MVNSQNLKASVSFVGDGSTNKFYFGFDYINKQFVKVQVGAGSSPLTYLTDYTVDDRSVVLKDTPAIGVAIRVYRETSSDRIVEWADGAFIKASQMTLENLQQLHLMEEAHDYPILNSLTKYPDGLNFNALGHRITNVKDPEDSSDVVTKHYMESVQNGFVQQNTSLANTATEAAGKAKDSSELAKKWAMSPVSPDGVVDTDSPTGYTQSAKIWASLSKEYAGLSKFKLPIGYYNSVSEMRKSETAIVGRPCVTLGYYAPNDGGSGVYIIRQKKENDVDDGGSVLFLDNGNVAELITDGTVNVKQWGAKEGTDISTIINNVIDHVVKKFEAWNEISGKNLPSIIIPYGKYYCTNSIVFKNSIVLDGCGSYIEWNGASTDSMITFSNISGVTTYCSHVTLKNVDMDYNGDKFCIDMDLCCSSFFENLRLTGHNTSVGIGIPGGWSNTFKNVFVAGFIIGIYCDVVRDLPNLYCFTNVCCTNCNSRGYFIRGCRNFSFINCDGEALGDEVRNYNGNEYADKIITIYGNSYTFSDLVSIEFIDCVSAEIINYWAEGLFKNGSVTGVAVKSTSTAGHFFLKIDGIRIINIAKEFDIIDREHSSTILFNVSSAGADAGRCHGNVLISGVSNPSKYQDATNFPQAKIMTNSGLYVQGGLVTKDVFDLSQNVSTTQTHKESSVPADKWTTVFLPLPTTPTGFTVFKVDIISYWGSNTSSLILSVPTREGVLKVYSEGLSQDVFIQFVVIYKRT